MNGTFFCKYLLDKFDSLTNIWLKKKTDDLQVASKLHSINFLVRYYAFYYICHTICKVAFPSLYGLFVAVTELCSASNSHAANLKKVIVSIVA